MMLQDKVVMVAGVGPGLGRAIALASAREGADVVLAARTAARLDDVAKEITGLGRRGLAVPTDLADAAAADHLAQAALDGFGRVDALVYNALAMPPRGIRVNSVAPGHIWGDSLKWYFGYLAHKRGVEVQEIYDETAAAIDLGRLPEPDEIADAVVFLASPLARAITGQCLDVNCGEYHH